MSSEKTGKTGKINAGVKMLQVLEEWGVDHLYGVPGGSFNSTMDALCAEQERIKYIQVRHEEVGAIAAAADAKLTGKIGVTFGSAGPGAVHLFNGLYDAREDHAPVLALVAQVATSAMNRYSFQEMNENPPFADVAVYNRIVETAEQLPIVVDNAIKEAYQKNGVAVVQIPVDLPTKEIDNVFITNAQTLRTPVLAPASDDVKQALKLLSEAKRPYLYFGRGCQECAKELTEFSEKFSVPLGSSVFAKGIIPDLYPNYMGMSGRVAWKTGNEASLTADLIIFIGSDFPFGLFFLNQQAKFIQIDIDRSKFGRRHHVDVAILGDAKLTLQKMIEQGVARPLDSWLSANQTNKDNWINWRHSFDDQASVEENVIRVEPVFKEIQKIAQKDAVFCVDVGNVTLNSARHLELNGWQKFTISGWYATMGYGVPAGIAASLSFPERQIITISGDGGFTMMMMGIITQVQYQLPIVNVVLTNRSLGFIEDEQEDTKQTKFGVKLRDVDFAQVAGGMGAIAFTVTNFVELAEAFDAATKLTNRPIVIDVKIDDHRPLPVEQLKLDPEKFSETEIKTFKDRFEVHDLPLLKDILASL